MLVFYQTKQHLYRGLFIGSVKRVSAVAARLVVDHSHGHGNKCSRPGASGAAIVEEARGTDLQKIC